MVQLLLCLLTSRHPRLPLLPWWHLQAHRCVCVSWYAIADSCVSRAADITAAYAIRLPQLKYRMPESVRANLCGDVRQLLPQFTISDGFIMHELSN